MLESKIEQDLKTALLAGDQEKVSILRGIKNALVYIKVAQKIERNIQLPDEEVMKVLAKEASKREESAGLYTKGGNIDRAKQELSERDIIVSYLPKQLTGQELVSIVDETIQELGLNDIRSMGVVIAAIKAKTSGSASGADIANKVRERLS